MDLCFAFVNQTRYSLSIHYLLIKCLATVFKLSDLTYSSKVDRSIFCKILHLTQSKLFVSSNNTLKMIVLFWFPPDLWSAHLQLTLLNYYYNQKLSNNSLKKHLQARKFLHLPRHQGSELLQICIYHWM